MKLTLGRRPVRSILTASTLALALVPCALAQAPQNAACVRLEGQLSSFDRNASDPARAEQVRRQEDGVNKEQFELDKASAQARRMGCEGGFFLFGQPPQCGAINAQVQQHRANVDRLQGELGRLQGASGPEREAQRRAILVALAQNDCGPQYRNQVAATPPPRGGLFESLFGANSIFSPGPAPGPGAIIGEIPQPASGNFRTICVRTCDGFFWPVSFATGPGRFKDDERICQRSCPAAEVALYSHRNPGEDVNQAVSMSGQPYTSLQNAFKYRQAFDQACSCRSGGQSWAQALKHLDDATVERGDIVVTEERARQLSQPRLDAQGKPIRPEPPARNARPDPRAQPATTPPVTTADEAPAQPDPKRTVRTVGPTFLPAR
jgi:hypothetical protein